MLYRKQQIKVFYSALLVIVLFLSTKLQAQVVINEVLPGGTVELKNIGTEIVDVSDYYLCDFPAYQRVGSSNVICGNLMLEAGGILSIDDFNVVEGADGEMGLYLNTSYSSPESLIDYVEWGTTGHQRSSVAVAAGIWTTGDFVPAFAENESLSYSGEGDLPSSWSASSNNSICSENISCEAEGGEISLDDGTDAAVICVDGVGDPLNVTVSGSVGSNSGWIITDLDNTILGLPDAPPFDLDGAGVGTCLIWYISYEEGLTGKEMGGNVADLEGCFDLSNEITVYREAADGGTVALASGETEYTGTAGDIVIDVSHTTASNNLSYWYIITDESDNILAFHNAADGPTLDLSGAPAGECHIWGWSYRGLEDPIAGENISTLTDDSCEAISENFIVVFRQEGSACESEGGEISLDDGTDAAVICVDGVGDPLNVTVSGSVGSNSGWIITDLDNTILGLPDAPPFDLDGAGVGTCLIWYISYEEGLTGKEMGGNVADLEGCFDLSNEITVYRESPDGGFVTLADGSTAYSGTAGDIVIDVTHTTTSNNLGYRYIITDDNDDILAFHNAADGPTLDLSGAPAGECHIWGWSYRGLEDPIAGENISTLTDDSCEAISENFIAVFRQDESCMVEGGMIALESGETAAAICVDGIGDPLNVNVTGSEGGIGGWIITDLHNNILGTPDGPSFDLDGAGVGTCLIWYIRYEDGLTGNMVGNTLSDLEGCFDISNAVTVYREAADGGMVYLANGDSEYASCIGDIVFDMKHSSNAPNLSYWYIITDAEDNILGWHNVADGPTIDLSEAPAGECHIWGWSYSGLDDPIMGENITTLTDDSCESVSENWVTIYREVADGGSVALANGDTEYANCAGEIVFEMSHLTDAVNLNYWYIITDEDDNILAYHDAANGDTLDLSGAPAGECHIWGWSYKGEPSPVMGEHISTLSDGDCESVSENWVSVFRENPDGGSIMTAAGDSIIDVCVGDGVFQVQHETSAPYLNYWYIITDADDNILAFYNSADGDTLDVSGAPAGVCHVWGWNSKGLEDPEVGASIATLGDDFCESTSENFITVNRVDTGDACSTSSTDQIPSVSELKVYPNPASDQVFVEYEGLKNGIGQMEMFDLNGKRIFSEHIQGSQNTKAIELNTLSSGLYIIRITSEDGVSSRRISVVK